MKRKKQRKDTQRPAKGIYHGVAFPRTDGKNDGKKSLTRRKEKRKND
tara:strand:- start:813 stop:953 length:141 start_codon:yes stop_codon:yes gene_type:complete